MRLCIFEDAGYKNLLPLAWLRPVYFLRCGITGLAEKIRSAYPGITAVYHCRGYLADYLREMTDIPVNEFGDDDYLFVNGRLLFDSEAARQIDPDAGECMYRSGDAVAAAVLQAKNAAAVFETAENGLSFSSVSGKITEKPVDVKIINYPWDLLTNNSVKIIDDFHRLYPEPDIKSRICDGCHCVNEKSVYIGENVNLKPGVILDAESGPVCIDDGAVVMANAVIEGPAYIGRETVVKIGAKIYSGTSVGEVCKIGGEISGSIIQSHSNKQHDGFLGNSYLGQWVNLGAGTDNSDLKNNYKPVRVKVNGVETDSGRMFVGLFMGDHGKSGIGTMFNTGTVAGIHCNVFGADYQRKYIPSFSWGGGDKLTVHDRDKAMETAAAVMRRRNVELSSAYLCLNSLIYEMTGDERKKFAV